MKCKQQKKMDGSFQLKKEQKLTGDVSGLLADFDNNKINNDFMGNDEYLKLLGKLFSGELHYENRALQTNTDDKIVERLDAQYSKEA